MAPNLLLNPVLDIVKTTRGLANAEVIDPAAQEKVTAKYIKPDLLIIDGMGIKQLPKRSGEYLFEIIMRQYETKPLIMTSNCPLEDSGKLLGDVPSATAILDRFHLLMGLCQLG